MLSFWPARDGFVTICRVIAVPFLTTFVLLEKPEVVLPIAVPLVSVTVVCAAVIENPALVADVAPLLAVATRVYGEAAAPLTEQPEKVATPATTVRALPPVHVRTPPPGLVPSVRVT